MKQCRFCRCESPDDQMRCSHCGTSLEEAVESWVSIARLTNLAEVGYFADLLEGEAVPSQVVQHNDFCAMSGAWSTVYVLRVPHRRSRAATDLLRDELERVDSDYERCDDNALGRAGLGSPLAAWKPMVLVLMAGGIAYCAGRLGVDAPPRAPIRQSLWEALSEDEQPLVSPRRDDTPSRRLRIEPATGSIVLEDDIDGDGHFRVRRFQNGQLVDEVR